MYSCRWIMNCNNTKTNFCSLPRTQILVLHELSLHDEFRGFILANANFQRKRQKKAVIWWGNRIGEKPCKVYGWVKYKLSEKIVQECWYIYRCISIARERGQKDVIIMLGCRIWGKDVLSCSVCGWERVRGKAWTVVRQANNRHHDDPTLSVFMNGMHDGSKYQEKWTCSDGGLALASISISMFIYSYIYIYIYTSTSTVYACLRIRIRVHMGEFPSHSAHMWVRKKPWLLTIQRTK